MAGPQRDTDRGCWTGNIGLVRNLRRIDNRAGGSHQPGHRRLHADGRLFRVYRNCRDWVCLVGRIGWHGCWKRIKSGTGHLVIYRDTNQLATGFALTLFGAGITAYAGRDYVDSIIGGLNPIAIPLLSDIHEIGKALFQQDILAYVAYALGPLLWVCLYYTRPGLSLRAVGESVDVAFAAGRNPQVIQIAAIAMGGALAGLGGAQLSLGLTHTWSEGMTVGRGFVAVGLVIFGMWSPLRAMIGALLFGGAIGLQLQLQTVGAPVSPFILDMLPYVVILLVMALWSRASARAMPEGLKGVLRATS